MSIKVEVEEAEVRQAVVNYAKAMMPPGWFKYEGIESKEDGSFIVSFDPIPEYERKPIDTPPALGEFLEAERERDANAARPKAGPRVGGLSDSGIMVVV